VTLRKSKTTRSKPAKGAWSTWFNQSARFWSSYSSLLSLNPFSTPPPKSSKIRRNPNQANSLKRFCSCMCSAPWCSTSNRSKLISANTRAKAPLSWTKNIQRQASRKAQWGKRSWITNLSSPSTRRRSRWTPRQPPPRTTAFVKCLTGISCGAWSHPDALSSAWCAGCSCMMTTP
jgi:hypothetical protein